VSTAGPFAVVAYTHVVPTPRNRVIITSPAVRGKQASGPGGGTAEVRDGTGSGDRSRRLPYAVSCAARRRLLPALPPERYSTETSKTVQTHADGISCRRFNVSQPHRNRRRRTVAHRISNGLVRVPLLHECERITIVDQR